MAESLLNCYDFPRYYEIAFSFRDISLEVDVIEETITKYARIPVRKILDLACGPCQHMLELARRGYIFHGLDANQSMLEYARARAERAAVEASFCHASMVNFTLDYTVDYVFIALGSLYATSSAELQSHLDSVAGALNRGGLFLLDWCIQFDPVTTFKDDGISWETLDGTTKVRASVRMRPISHVEQLFEEQLEMEVDDAGSHLTLASYSIKRAIYPQEFLSIIHHREDFEFVGWWNNWNLAQPLEVEDLEIFRPIALLRRT